jgi:hypothetical protein
MQPDESGDDVRPFGLFKLVGLDGGTACGLGVHVLLALSGPGNECLTKVRARGAWGVGAVGIKAQLL